MATSTKLAGMWYFFIVLSGNYISQAGGRSHTFSSFRPGEYSGNLMHADVKVYGVDKNRDHGEKFGEMII